jgi:hypothetical protein
MNKLAGSTLAAVATIGVLGVAPTAAHASEVCATAFSRSYTSEGYSWVNADGETIKNSTAATFSRTITYTFTATVSTTVSGEVGVKAGTAVAEVNAKFGVSVSASVSVSKSDSFTVSVPAKTSITYRSGIIKRQFHVVEKTTYSNCDTKSVGGYVYAADKLTVIS